MKHRLLFGGTLSEFDFAMEYTSMSYIARQMKAEERFIEHITRNSRQASVDTVDLDSKEKEQKLEENQKCGADD